jgi:hypothetical protein
MVESALCRTYLCRVHQQKRGMVILRRYVVKVGRAACRATTLTCACGASGMVGEVGTNDNVGVEGVDASYLG